MIPSEQGAVAVAAGSREEFAYYGFGVGNFALASSGVQVAAEGDEGSQEKACVGDVVDDIGRLRGFGGSPVVGDGLGDASEFDDRQFGGESGLEGVESRRLSWERVMGWPPEGASIGIRGWWRPVSSRG